MESDNLPSGNSPPPNELTQPEKNAPATKPKRRKRGKGRPLTHHKIGSRGGRPRGGDRAIDEPSGTTDASKVSLFSRLRK